MRCKVGGWGLDHDPPSALMDYIPPTFTPPRPPGRPSPIRVVSSMILLLRSAVDIEVHGGSIEASSVADHVTLRPSNVCLAPPEGGTRCKTKHLLPYSYVQPNRGPQFPRGMARASSGPWSPPPMLPAAGRGRRPGMGRGGVVGWDPCCFLVILA